MRTQGQAYNKRLGVQGAFDAVVVGSGIGGLGVASILAQQGRRVLVLEQHNVIGGLTQSYERAGYRWTVGLHYIGNVASPRTTTWRIFDYATRGAITWAPMPEVFNRMIIGEREHPIPAGAEAYRRALHARFPREHAAVDRYLDLIKQANRASAPYFAQQALPHGPASEAAKAGCGEFHAFSDRLTIDVLSELTQDAELIAVLCANWGDYGIEPSRSSFAMHSMLAMHYLNGASYPVGGGQAFADAIVPIIETAGGCVLHSAEVARVLVSEGRVTGIRLTSGEVVVCDTVISGAGVRNSYGRLLEPEAARAAGVDTRLDQVQDSYAVVGLNIGLEGSALALGFEPANIWAHPTADLEANLAAHRADYAAPFPWTFITFPSAKDPSWDQAYPGKATIEMYACSDYRHFEAWAGTRWMKRGADYEARKIDIERRLLDDLYRLVPQARGAVRHVEVSTPVSYETFVKRQRGDFMGIESSPSRFRQDWLRARTPIQGYYLTGQDVTSDGVIGALVGGVICASAVLEQDMMSKIQTSPPSAQIAP